MEKRERGNGQRGLEERCGVMGEGLGFIEKGTWRKLQQAAAMDSAFPLLSLRSGETAEDCNKSLSVAEGLKRGKDD